jgi:hypothetical protein
MLQPSTDLHVSRHCTNHFERVNSPRDLNTIAEHAIGTYSICLFLFLSASIFSSSSRVLPSQRHQHSRRNDRPLRQPIMCPYARDASLPFPKVSTFYSLLWVLILTDAVLCVGDPLFHSPSSRDLKTSYRPLHPVPEDPVVGNASPRPPHNSRSPLHTHRSSEIEPSAPIVIQTIATTLPPKVATRTTRRPSSLHFPAWAATSSSPPSSPHRRAAHPSLRRPGTDARHLYLGLDISR